MIRIVKKADQNGGEEIVFLNPLHVTAVIQKRSHSEVHFFGHAGFIGTNVIQIKTNETAESVSKRMEEKV